LEAKTVSDVDFEKIIKPFKSHIWKLKHFYTIVVKPDYPTFKSHIWKLKQSIIFSSEIFIFPFKSHIWKLKLQYDYSIDLCWHYLNPIFGS